MKYNIVDHVWLASAVSRHNMKYGWLLCVWDVLWGCPWCSSLVSTNSPISLGPVILIYNNNKIGFAGVNLDLWNNVSTVFTCICRWYTCTCLQYFKCWVYYIMHIYIHEHNTICVNVEYYFIFSPHNSTCMVTCVRSLLRKHILMKQTSITHFLTNMHVHVHVLVWSMYICTQPSVQYMI